METSTLELSADQRECRECSVQGLCLPGSLAPEELGELEGILGKPRPLPAQAHLYRAGEPCEALFAVRSGLVKTITCTPEGAEQVIGFYLAGDVLGFDGLAEGRHRTSAATLDTTTICLMPLEGLDRLGTAFFGLHRSLRQIMARELAHEETVMRALRGLPSEARVIAFLLRLSERFQERDLDGLLFPLRMSNRDLGNHLDLRPETVSRHLAGLHRQGLIRFQRRGRTVRLRDPEALRARVPGYEKEFQIRPWAS